MEGFAFVEAVLATGVGYCVVEIVHLCEYGFVFFSARRRRGC